LLASLQAHQCRFNSRKSLFQAADAPGPHEGNDGEQEDARHERNPE
jgi:hypothetical protein